jgi:hypothetical protein
MECLLHCCQSAGLDAEFRASWRRVKDYSRFRRMDDILAAIDDINPDYERHSREPRAVAEQYFKAETVLDGTLNDGPPASSYR